MTEHPDITQLSAHLDDELDRAATAQVSAHLLACPTCQQQYRRLRELSLDMNQLPVLTPELDIAALLERLAPRQQPASQSSWRRALPGAAAAASLVLGLLIGAGLQGPAPAAHEQTFAALAILDSTPPGALCRQPELCYLQGTRP